MKRKNSKASRKTASAVVKTPDVPVIDKSADGGKPSAAPVPPVVTYSEFPPPEYLLEEARKEPNRKVLQDYEEVISVLRDEKDFSFREIAEWLTQNGVDADYNAVYRVYTKGMSEDQERDVALREAEEERDEVQG